MPLFSCAFCGKGMDETNKYCSESCGRKFRYRESHPNSHQRKIRPKRDIKEIKKSKSEYFKKWYAEHREIQNANMRDYYRRNKEKVRSRCNISLYRKKVLELHKNQCDVCGSVKKLELHHIDYVWERDKDGRNGFSLNVNKVKVLCHTCHLNVHGRMNHKDI